MVNQTQGRTVHSMLYIFSAEVGIKNNRVIYNFIPPFTERLWHVWQNVSQDFVKMWYS